MSASVVFFWINVTLEKGSQLNLSGASVGSLVDDERSWPAPGNLLIDGLTYSGFGLGLAPVDADTRLRWIALQPQYHPQPYRQLAKVLREIGDEKGAVKVMVAEGDARLTDRVPRTPARNLPEVHDRLRSSSPARAMVVARGCADRNGDGVDRLTRSPA